MMGMDTPAATEVVQSIVVNVLKHLHAFLVRDILKKILACDSFHTEPEDTEDFDVKAWSRQGHNLRCMTSLDAGNRGYHLLWQVLLIVMEVCGNLKDTISLPPLLLDVTCLLRECCNRWPRLLSTKEADTGDVIEAMLGDVFLNALL